MTVRPCWRVPVLLCLLLAAIAATPCVADDVNRYWDWGVGCYYGGMGAATDLDVAMYDWLYLCFGNIGATTETVDQLNRLLEINPKLKIVVRVWPIMSLGDCKENRYQATFLHHHYQPGVKDKLLQNVRDQIALVMDNISRPENVVGLTFLEELPGHFSAAPFMRELPEGELPWDLARFKDEIEAERGKPLVWDDETRLWWGEKWAQAINDIHAEMKKASDGRLVFYYQQTNHSSLEMVPEGTPLSTPGLMPVKWAEIIKPGLCDGFFAYPNNRQIWDRYLKLARDNDWLLFSQVSHPGFMRLCDWDECVEMAREKDPRNLGYFFYCQGDCAATKAWNCDRSIPPGAEWNTRGLSVKLHARRHLAEQGVGRDVVAAQPLLQMRLDLPLDGAKAASYIHPRVIVENVREASVHLDPQDAIARDAQITLTVPEAFAIDREKSPPPTLKLGDLAPGDVTVADWWVAVEAGFDGAPKGPFTVTARSAGAAAATVSASADTSVEFGLPHEITDIQESWLEAGYRLSAAEVAPKIVIEPLHDTVRNPSVSDEYATIRYQGVLNKGDRLVIDPAAGAILQSSALVDNDGADRVQEDDPTGFGALDDGYLVGRVRANVAVRPTEPLRVTVSGKAEDGAQSLIVLRYLTDGDSVDQSVLVNRFADQWRTVSQTVTPPENAKSLDWVYLYRFNQKGKVWYGPVKVERGNASEEGVDVSDALRGRFPTVSRSEVRIYSYTDDSAPGYRPRVRVQLLIP